MLFGQCKIKGQTVAGMSSKAKWKVDKMERERQRWKGRDRAECSRTTSDSSTAMSCVMVFSVTVLVLSCLSAFVCGRRHNVPAVLLCD